MPALLITYDLNRPMQRYNDLYAAIRSLGETWHKLDSTWIVATRRTPDQAMAVLEPCIDANDSVLVIDVTGARRQGWLTQADWQWLDDHL